jgi:glycine oxidase
MRIVIIGAGVAGLGIGWRLRQKGAEVTVLERAQPAQAATWASAGMLAVAGELGDADTEEAKFARHSRGLWSAFAAELEEASGLAIDYRENGALITALSADEAGALQSGTGLKRLSPEETRALEPMLTADIRGALFAPGEAQVNTRLLGEALARAFVRAGGTLSPNEAVIRIESEAGSARSARTPFGRYEADAFILAAGAWSADIEGLPRDAVPPVSPVKGQMIALAPPKGAALPARVVWGAGVYLVPRGPQLLVGATSEDAGFDTGVTREAADWLAGQACTLMPPLASWSIADHWAGLRPGSPDGLPMLGPSALDRLYVATGQFRNGILYAPAVAELLARLVLAPAPEKLAFDPRRFSGGSRKTP